jgi:nitroreductase
MNTMDALLTRRSIRKYKSDKVEKDKIDKILRAAMYAPSAMNLQPWDFVVINTEEAMQKAIQAIPHGTDILKEAQAALLVCGDNKIEQNIDYIVQNCSAAIQNILLAAHEFGLGSCWIAIYPLQEVIESVKKKFELPEHIIPIALVSLGYSDENPEAGERFLSKKIHYNKW